MKINDFIKNYDFSNSLSSVKENFKQRSIIQKYLENNSEENFINFSEAFWRNPSLSIDGLKQKYNINKQIAFGDIIKAYPTNEYVRFLKMYHSNLSLDSLITEFAIPFNRMENLIVPLIINGSDRYCINCFSDIFEIIRDVNITYFEEVICRCQSCNTISKYSELLTKERAEEELERINHKKTEFDEKILKYEDILKDIKCPKCQEKLSLSKLNNTFSYRIRCNRCNYISYNIDDTVKDFQEWKQRAAMMIAIKAKEQELIEKALESKKEQDISFTKEDIITSKENNSTLDFFNMTSEMDNIQLWREMLKRVKSCNRLEKKLLSKIIEITKAEGDRKQIPFKNNEATVYAYMPKEPIIYNLINKTKIIVVRQIIRRLMAQNFLLASEEGNYILVPEILISNLETINNLMIVNDISPNIRYLVLQRQNFTCMTCGETGRPLKIAYLSSDKNINDLSSIMALCDNCYELITRNEILIDGSITFEVDFLDKKRLKSLEFLIQYYPELKNDEFVIKTLEDWDNDYNLSDIIKALTITTDKIKKNKLEGTINTLLSYTNAILKKSAETENPVYIYDNLKEQYNLAKWIEDLID